MPPIAQHRDLKHLVSDALRLPSMVKYRSRRVGALHLALMSPAAIAFWINKFAPELLDRPTLKITVLGADMDDSMDDGCWYSLVPWMLDYKGAISIDLVGPDVEFKGDRSHRTASGTLSMVMDKPDSAFPPAQLHARRASDYLMRLDSKNESKPDLFVLFQPGLEDSIYSWFQPGELDGVCRVGSRIAITSYAKAESLGEDWLLRARGFTPVGEHVDNPFKGKVNPGGAFAAVAWELAAKPPRDDHEVDPSAIDRFEHHLRLNQSFIESFGFISEEDAGQVVTLPVLDGKEVSNRPVIRSPRKEIGFSLQTGQVIQMDRVPAIFHKGLEDLSVPRSMLESRPDSKDHPFERLLWSFEMYEQFSRLVGDDNETDEDDDERIELPGLEDFMEGIGEIIKEVTGKDVDPEEFINQMRLGEGLRPPVHPAWHDLLETLGWDPQNYQEEPERFEPAMTFHSKSRRTIPLVCESYSYMPDDKEDDLANEAKSTLSKRYPDGVMLVFKNMPFVEMGKDFYSFGGLFYDHQSWRPFALAATMNSVDDLLKQLSKGFRFDAPNKAYRDQHAQLSFALSAMTSGLDPNTPFDRHSMRTGDWHVPLVSEFGSIDSTATR